MSNTNKSKGNNFLLQGSILAIAGIITKIIGLVYRVPLNNIIGPEGMGYYSVAYGIYVVALTLTSYSLPLAVSKLVSARVAKRQYKNAYKVFLGALFFALVVGGLTTLFLFFGAGFLSSYVMNMAMAAYSLRVLAPCIVIVALLGVIRGFFQGMGSMVPTAISQVIEQIVNAVVSISGAYLLFKAGTALGKEQNNPSLAYAYGATGGTLGTVMGAFFALVFMALIFFSYKKYYKRKMQKDVTKKTESYKSLFIALILTITPVILSSAINSISDILDVAIYNGVMAAQGVPKREFAKILGEFSGKYVTITLVPLSVSMAVSSSFIPSLVAAMQEGKKKPVFQKIDASIRFNMMIAIPSAVGLFVLARPILDLLFTSDNTLAGSMLHLGAVSVIFFCLGNITTSILIGLDEMLLPVKNSVIALIIYIASLCLMLIVFKWGIYSVIWGRIIFSLALSIFNSRSIKHCIGYVQELKRAVIIPGIASLIMGVVTFLIHLVIELFIPGKLATLIACLVAVSTYSISLVLLGGITQEEMNAMPKGRTLVKIAKKLHLYR
ncbi:O-antigen/teichoic acid export membrane protein [Aequitasia blattaphilus]|uniref:Polysaccharide biosynthesis protein n=1 Tax=Aequitasia blattaphilus TaxID=2949332 RepID=A0ABT1E765_9FIRM|nr:polysaccharide biosynthesis protein [Aequitasia blattaphilus]MCP1101680.1 polysaccharide biosynthesis protein [Aequitasia blattaphilus]MCR8614320.1 polysaccharide biosynthesis protein [Aequitasia blattaphilus]